MYSHPLLYDWIRAEHERRIRTPRYDVPRVSRKAARRGAGPRFAGLRTAFLRPQPAPCGCTPS